MRPPAAADGARHDDADGARPRAPSPIEGGELTFEAQVSVSWRIAE